MGTSSKNVPSAVTKAQILCNKRTIQPNNKAPRRTLTLTLTILNETNWKLSLNALVVVSVGSLDVPTGAFVVRKASMDNTQQALLDRWTRSRTC